MNHEVKIQEEEDLEYLIEDWYWDKKSYKFARSMGIFMLGFFVYLRRLKLSESTIRKHESNCELIGKLISDYGFHKTFTPDIFSGEPDHLIEFKRKISNTKYMVESYKATWRKLAKYSSLQPE